MGQAASASQMGRFETEWLTRPENFAALADLPGQWIDTVHRRRSPRIVVLDMDSSESPTYGEQEGSAYNGHFGCTCYHPLFVSNQLGDLERCGLRPGNVHSADGWRGVLEPVVSRYRGKGTRLYFRGDAAFANPEIYEFFEVEGMGYAIRFPANRILQEKIGYLLKRRSVDRRMRCAATMPASATRRRAGRSPAEWWRKSSGIQASFIRGSASSSPTWRGRPSAWWPFYNQRGTCEQWIKEGKAAIRWTRLSCRSFAANAFAFSSMRWPTTSATSCEPWRCPRQRSRGP